MCPPRDGGAGFCQTIMFCLDHSRSSFLVLSSRVVLVFGCLSRTSFVSKDSCDIWTHLPRLLLAFSFDSKWFVPRLHFVFCFKSLPGVWGGGELFYSLFVLCALIDLWLMDRAVWCRTRSMSLVMVSKSNKIAAKSKKWATLTFLNILVLLKYGFHFLYP